MMNREQLEAELAVLDLSDAMDALKGKIRDGDDSEETRNELQAAKLAVYNARQALRQNRAAPEVGDGVAEPEIVATKTKGG